MKCTHGTLIRNHRVTHAQGHTTIRSFVSLSLTFLLGTALSNPVWCRVRQVGPNREIKDLRTVASNLGPGDVVEIDSGTYREVVRLTANGTKDQPIVIRGVGRTRPVFDGKGLDVSGRGSVPRAILEIQGAYYVIEHLEFRNARNGENAAGIRLLGSTNAVIRDCKVSYCDMGIFGGDRETALIEACDVGFNGTAEFNGYSHNFYMSGNRVVVRSCHIHDSLYGQNYKSRAHYNELWYNWIADSNEGEVGPVDGKGATDRPNSNVLMVGNIIVSKPDRTGNNAKFILFGSESGGSHDGTLYMFHNTLVAGSPKIVFVQLHDPKARAVIHNNIFLGSNRILAILRQPLSVAGSHNWMPSGAEPPREFTASVSGNDPGFVDPGTRDFRLKRASPCANQGIPEMQYVDGDGFRHRVIANQCYVPHLRLNRRITVGAPDLGAFELSLGPEAHRIPDNPAGFAANLLNRDSATRGKLHIAYPVLHHRSMRVLISTKAVDYAP